MAKKEQQCCEKFKTVIGGQALIEGIMMRGPEKDAVVVRSNGELVVDVKARKLPSKRSILKLPFIRGVHGFFDSQVTGVKALMQSADLSPEESQEESSKFDQWLEKRLGSEKFQKFLIGSSVLLGLAFSVGLFIVLPATVSGLLSPWIPHPVLQQLVEGVVRLTIFLSYMLLVSRMKEMRRVFSYHGAEHKTIRCYEAGLPLTVENVRPQTRLHPRCGTSFLLVVMILSILVFSVTTSLLRTLIPGLVTLETDNRLLYQVIMMGCRLAMLPVVVAITYEINRLVGRHDNWLTRILSAPGMWFQNFTTNEPDDSMIEVAIAALEAVLPQEEGADRW